jgi:hypothetical protein
MTGTNFSSWYRDDEGTLYGDAVFVNTDSGRLIACLQNTTANTDRITIGNGSSTGFNGAVVAGSVVQASINSGTKALNGKIAIVYKTNDFAISGNGGSVGTDTAGTLPAIVQLSIGVRDVTTASYINGTIKKLTYYPKRLTNEELQGLTTN